MDRVSHIVYINLDRRKDRRAEFERDLVDKFDFFGPVERFSAINWVATPKQSCTASHLSIWREALKNGWETTLIFEDDAVLVTSREEFDTYVTEFLKDPSAEILMLGYNIFKRRKVSDYFYRALKTTCMHCYIIKQSVLPHLIRGYFESDEIFKQFLEFGFSTEQMREVANNLPAPDLEAWHRIHEKHIVFAPIRLQVEQRPSYSDIIGKLTFFVTLPGQ